MPLTQLCNIQYSQLSNSAYTHVYQRLPQTVWLVQIPEDHAPVAQENWTPASMYVCQFICGIVFHGNSLFKKLLCTVVEVCWKVLLGGSVLCVL